MAKLIILSIVLVSFALPIWFSGEKEPRRALRRMQRFVIVFIVIWTVMCLEWYPALVQLK